MSIIIDMYTDVLIGFEMEIYEVDEGDGIVRVYVSVLDGELSNDVVIGITTDVGSALGNNILCTFISTVSI